MDTKGILTDALIFSLALIVAPAAHADGFILNGTSFSILNVPGALAYPGTNSTETTGINDAGTVVGAYAEGGVNHAFLYSEGHFTVVDVPGGQLYLTSGINNAGEFIVDSSLGSLLYNNGSFTSVPGATGINNLGQIVGDNGSSGYILTGNSYVYLDMPGVASFVPLAINDSGQVVGGYADSQGEFGFLYSNGAFTTIACPVQGTATRGGLTTLVSSLVIASRVEKTSGSWMKAVRLPMWLCHSIN